MENAAKALTMAGGVLIAIMVISALVYASSTLQVIPKAQDESEKVRQLSLFNQQYESYAKGALYGTDLLSLLNKAIDNNDRYNVNASDRMYIDIKFTLLTNVDTTNITYKKYYDGPKKGTTEQVGTSSSTGKLSLTAKSYSLSKDGSTIKTFVSQILDSKEYKVTSKTTYGSDNGGKYRTYTVETPDISEFKLRIFKCEEYTYDSEGRINSMVFKEQEQTEETT